VKIRVLRLKMSEIQFAPLICENYRLVPETYSEILNRIKDELWAEFQCSYEILTLSI